MLSTKNILIICSGIIAGVGICSLFRACDADKADTIAVIKPSTLEKNAEKEEKHFTDAIDSLQVKAKTLQSILTTTIILLDKSKKKNGLLQSQLRNLANKNITRKDTAAFYADCDSVKDNLSQWIEVGHEKDSLYEAVIGNQQDQLQVKDSTIWLQQQQHTILKGFFQQSLLQQELLANQHKRLQKKMKRQQFKNKLLSGLTVVAAGIATGYLLKQ